MPIRLVAFNDFNMFLLGVRIQVLEKGVPEEALPGIVGKQVPLLEDCKSISGLLNSQGVKVRWNLRPL